MAVAQLTYQVTETISGLDIKLLQSDTLFLIDNGSGTDIHYYDKNAQNLEKIIAVDEEVADVATAITDETFSTIPLDAGAIYFSDRRVVGIAAGNTPVADFVTGTATAGGASSITLTGTSAVDSYYNGYIVSIISGTGSGQKEIITGYVGATKVATVQNAWVTQPDNTSVYSIAVVGCSIYYNQSGAQYKSYFLELASGYVASLFGSFMLTLNISDGATATGEIEHFSKGNIVKVTDNTTYRTVQYNVLGTQSRIFDVTNALSQF